MSVSGHKNAQSIRAYSRTGEKMRKKMFDALSNALKPAQAEKKLEPSSSTPTLPTTTAAVASTVTAQAVFPTRQDKLGAISSVPTFDFAVSSAFDNIDMDDVTIMQEVNQLDANTNSNTNPILQNKPLLNQLLASSSSTPQTSVQAASQSARPYFYFASGSNPVFINSPL